MSVQHCARKLGAQGLLGGLQLVRAQAAPLVVLLVENIQAEFAVRWGLELRKSIGGVGGSVGAWRPRPDRHLEVAAR